MKRILFVVLCALILVGTVPGSADADRRVYDTPGDGRPVVGDDDEPLFRAPIGARESQAAPVGNEVGGNREPFRTARSATESRDNHFQSLRTLWAQMLVRLNEFRSLRESR